MFGFFQKGSLVRILLDVSLLINIKVKVRRNTKEWLAGAHRFEGICFGDIYEMLGKLSIPKIPAHTLQEA